MSQPQSSHSSPDKCSVYWDYENMPISRRGELSEFVCEIRQRLWASDSVPELLAWVTVNGTVSVVFFRNGIAITAKAK